MRRLISSQIKKISFFSRINIEALHFISEKITRHLKFLQQEEHWQEYRGNKPQGLYTPSEQNEAPHYIFRKK
jgi:hypothetical protein